MHNSGGSKSHNIDKRNITTGGSWRRGLLFGNQESHKVLSSTGQQQQCLNSPPVFSPNLSSRSLGFPPQGDHRPSSPNLIPPLQVKVPSSRSVSNTALGFELFHKTNRDQKNRGMPEPSSGKQAKRICKDIKSSPQTEILNRTLSGSGEQARRPHEVIKTETTYRTTSESVSGDQTKRLCRNIKTSPPTSFFLDHGALKGQPPLLIHAPTDNPLNIEVAVQALQTSLAKLTKLGVELGKMDKDTEIAAQRVKHVPELSTPRIGTKAVEQIIKLASSQGQLSQSVAGVNSHHVSQIRTIVDEMKELAIKSSSNDTMTEDQPTCSINNDNEEELPTCSSPKDDEEELPTCSDKLFEGITTKQHGMADSCHHLASDLASISSSLQELVLGTADLQDFFNDAGTYSQEMDLIEEINKLEERYIQASEETTELTTSYEEDIRLFDELKEEDRRKDTLLMEVIRRETSQMYFITNAIIKEQLEESVRRLSIAENMAEDLTYSQESYSLLESIIKSFEEGLDSEPQDTYPEDDMSSEDHEDVSRHGNSYKLLTF
ncbi:hypothetical protein BC941DRAFT_436836 [Chlamydoabsidia padenii]|nr:hypothetical protein BC941DRAFT_436836 [Chlamydoabsidia padenii]